MTLFLEWDTARENPVGFEKPCVNFFDPAEDDQDLPHFNFEDINDDNENDEDDKNSQPESKKVDDGNNSNNLHLSSSEITEAATALTPASIPSSFVRNNDENRGRIRARSTRVRNSPKRKKRLYCIRPGCKKKPRFDSAFCSDGCGIITMEKDLLSSLQYASDMHPYELRP